MRRRSHKPTTITQWSNTPFPRTQYPPTPPPCTLLKMELNSFRWVQTPLTSFQALRYSHWEDFNSEVSLIVHPLVNMVLSIICPCLLPGGACPGSSRGEPIGGQHRRQPILQVLKRRSQHPGYAGHSPPQSHRGGINTSKMSGSEYVTILPHSIYSKYKHFDF